MIDSKELNRIIRDSGMKREHIAKILGITSNSLKNKIEGRTDFKSKEILVLKKILNLSIGQIGQIFFGEELELNSNFMGA